MYNTSLFLLLLLQFILTTAFSPRVLFEGKQGKHSKNTKGVSDTFRPRLAFGEKASIQEYPYYASMLTCGATILSDRWVVTAARCVGRKSNHVLFVGGDNIFKSNVVLYDQVVYYPEYQLRNGIIQHDIALLRLYKPLNFTDKIKPLNLPGSDYHVQYHHTDVDYSPEYNQEHFDSDYFYYYWGEYSSEYINECSHHDCEDSDSQSSDYSDHHRGDDWEYHEDGIISLGSPSGEFTTEFGPNLSGENSDDFEYSDSQSGDYSDHHSGDSDDHDDSVTSGEFTTDFIPHYSGENSDDLESNDSDEQHSDVHLLVGSGLNHNGKIAEGIMTANIFVLPASDFFLDHYPEMFQSRPDLLWNMDEGLLRGVRVENMPAAGHRDAGSPLVKNNTLVGILSFSIHKPDEMQTRWHTQTSFYVNVASYVPWIKSVTGL